MGVVAEASIKLLNVNDGYSLSISPESIAVTADMDGGNADLTNALTYIRLYRGDKHMYINVESVVAITGDTDEESGIESVTDTTLTACDEDGNADSSVVIQGDDNRDYAPCWQLKLEEISEELTSGGVTFTVTCEDEYEIEGRFTYTVVRDSSSLDWIKDWDGGATKIGDVYVITPKIFVGEKISNDEDTASTLLELGSLSGVYIGPARQVYGSDANDGLSGVYGIYEGEVTFKIDGEGGYIAGWTIESDSLWSAHIELYQGEDNKYIAVSKSEVAEKGKVYEAVSGDSGCAMYYTNDTDYGFKTYSNSVSVFSAGSENYIGPWNFDEDALWYGTKKNTAGEYTSKTGYITMGTEGIRGYQWYLDTDGTCSFVGGIVSFTASEGKIGGWNIMEYGLWSEHAVLYSSKQGSTAGFAFSSAIDMSDITQLRAAALIAARGGVYLRSSENEDDDEEAGDSSNTVFAGYDNDGDLLFELNGLYVCKIAGWYFSADSLYISDDGDEPTPDETTGLVEDGELLLTADGLYGSSWALLPGGTGLLADGNIYWDSNGTFHMTVCEVSGFIRTEPRVIKDTTDDFDSIDGTSRLGNIDVRNLYKGGLVYLAALDEDYIGDRLYLPMLIKYAGAQVTIVVKGSTKYLRIEGTEDVLDSCEEDVEYISKTAPDGNQWLGWNEDGDEVYVESPDGAYSSDSEAEEMCWVMGKDSDGNDYHSSDDYENVTSGDVLLGLRLGDTAIQYVQFNSSSGSDDTHVNKVLRLMAVPYHQDAYDLNGGSNAGWRRGMVEWVILNTEDFTLYTDAEDDDGNTVPYARYNQPE